jgi:coenzyme F420-reducing hydrogenase beta subunit
MIDKDSNSDFNSQSIFSTKETALAAYLLTEGFNLIDVEVDNDNYGRNRKPSVFLFENSSELQVEAKSFRTFKAVVNAANFFESYRRCLRMTKIGKM